MSVFLQRFFLATALGCIASVGFADEAKDKDEAEAAAKPTEIPIEADKEYAEKLKKRHHEGDVALGVCGGRLTALMWFYQSSVADGREDLQKSFEAIRDSREVLKSEAERRAVDDGVTTSVTVMNEHSTDLWEQLIESSEDVEGFQEVHDKLYTDVQECLNLFFRRGTKKKAPGAESEADEGGEDAKEEKPKE